MQLIAPHRATHTYIQRLNGAPAEVFPLLCPVRECDWVNGWEPSLVVTASGRAERDCIFVVDGPGSEATWVITTYEPPSRIEFIKVVARETVGRISIDLRSDGIGGTEAEVTYSYTAVSERGRVAVDGFTAEFYHRFMNQWEAELNHYLATGRKKSPAGAESE